MAGRLLLTAALVLVALCLATGTALAAPVHVLTPPTIGGPGSGPGQLSLTTQSGVAVNQTSGDVYVADTGNKRISQFQAGGTFVRTFGTFSLPTFIAIDNNTGDVYVGNYGNATVSKFQADGTPITSWGVGGTLKSAPTGQFNELTGIAVSPNGNLFVYGREPRQVFKFTASGGFIESFEPQFGSEAVGIAVDSTEAIYKVRLNIESVAKLDATGSSLLGELDPGPAHGLAVDPSNDEVYAADLNHIARYAADGTQLEGSIGSGQLSAASGIAVRQSNHELYVAEASANQIVHFSFEDVAPAVATIDPVASPAPPTPHVTGTVDPEGHGTTCKFEYVTDSHFISEGFSGASSTPCAINPGSGTSPVAVEADLIGLPSGGSYHVRLGATNAAGTTFSAEPNPSFETEVVTPPSVEILAPTDLTGTSAHFNGEVSPNAPGAAPQDPAYDTTWRFECTPSCSGPSGTLKGDDSTHSVGGDIDLTANTHYTLTLIAENAAGKVEKTTSFDSPAVVAGVITSFNTPEAEGKVRLLGYVNPLNSEVSDCHFEYGPDTSYGSEGPCTPAHPGNELQQLFISATEGRFRLRFASETTPSLPFDATAAEVQSALESLPAIGAGSVLVTGGPGDADATTPYEISFKGDLALKDVEVLSTEEGSTPLGGGSVPSPTKVETTTPGSPSDNEQQQLFISATEGQFLLRFASETTPNLPFNATAAEVQSALESLTAIGAGNVSVTGGPGDAGATTPYEITFEGNLALQDVEELSAEAGKAPLGGGNASSATRVETIAPGGPNQPVGTFTHLSGLDSGTTYHYRLVVTNAVGTEESDDATFTTVEEPPTADCSNTGALGADQLDECRAWEMVSPADKNGGDVIGAGDMTQIAEDGSAASFSSLAPFGDTNGDGVDSAYLSLRTPAGWATHGTKPPMPPVPLFGITRFGLYSHYVLDLSPDLDQGVFLAWRPLDDSEPNVANAPNVYVRKDMRSAGEGDYELVSPCPLCAEAQPAEPLPELTFEKRPWPAGRTPDFSHVLFESEANLAAGAEGTELKLYEYTGGTLRVAGILPDGTPAAGSVAGSGGSAAFHPPPHTISADGSKIFFSAGGKVSERGGENLYMRLNGTETVQLNTPEAGTGQLAKARFWDATPDGSKVFFSAEDQAYMYDTTKQASDPHNLTLLGGNTTTPVISIVGASPAASTVYFITDHGQLEPGAPPPASSESLFAWHEGEVRFLAGISNPNTGRHLVSGEHLSRVSADGELLFASDNRIEPTGYHQPEVSCNGDSNVGCTEYYLYDPHTEALQCVSCSPEGDAPTASAQVNAEVSKGGADGGRHENRLLSDDGRYAFFNTPQSLVREDSNGVEDPYLFDSQTATVHLLSSGTDPNPSYFLESDPSGSNALFMTREQISARDIDQGFDLYDARVDGGLPEPRPAPAPCEGETCRPAPAPAPAGGSAASARFNGTPNPKPNRRKHRKPRKHRKHSKAKQHQSKAKHERGVSR